MTQKKTFTPFLHPGGEHEQPPIPEPTVRSLIVHHAAVRKGISSLKLTKLNDEDREVDGRRKPSLIHAQLLLSTSPLRCLLFFPATSTIHHHSLYCVGARVFVAAAVAAAAAAAAAAATAAAAAAAVNFPVTRLSATSRVRSVCISSQFSHFSFLAQIEVEKDRLAAMQKYMAQQKQRQAQLDIAAETAAAAAASAAATAAAAAAAVVMAAEDSKPKDLRAPHHRSSNDNSNSFNAAALAAAAAAAAMNSSGEVPPSMVSTSQQHRFNGPVSDCVCVLFCLLKLMQATRST